jgi:NAD(P)-dependent dehydrogenase (short-subunit alcohol dehydrogenase family)
MIGTLGGRVAEGVVLVTGGNSGIGFECARELARRGTRVLIASRNQQASDQAVRRIARESGEGSASALALDLGSLASVRAFAREIEARDLPLRARVCNAGLQMNAGPKLTPDGFESTFAVNHLGHFLLVNLLLSRLLANAPARIVIVASGVHDPAMKTLMPHPAIMDFETLAATGGASKTKFDGRVAYVNSKLCSLWFSCELVRRIEAAGLSSDARPLSVNAWEAGLVLDPALEKRSGRYFPSHSRWREAPSSDLSYDAGKAAELWRESLRMTRLAPGESPLLGV